MPRVLETKLFQLLTFIVRTYSWSDVQEWLSTLPIGRKVNASTYLHSIRSVMWSQRQLQEVCSILYYYYDLHLLTALNFWSVFILWQSPFLNRTSIYTGGSKVLALFLHKEIQRGIDIKWHQIVSLIGMIIHCFILDSQ